MRFTLGPATFVTAAFIGPGTITMCITAGVQDGYALLWALFLATCLTVFIQNIAARIAHTTGVGLAQSSLSYLSHPVMKLGMSMLLISALFLGNAAYEAGNLSGAMLGFEGMMGQAEEISSRNTAWGILVMALLLSVVLWQGKIGLIKKILVGVVVVMSLSFLLTAALTFPDPKTIATGFLQPAITAENSWTILGLLGTTIVPYNLFLHAALVAESPGLSLAEIRRDTFFAVGMGGLISMSILICGAAFQGSDHAHVTAIGGALAPLFGELSSVLLYVGFFAAGFTSALTAPLAASHVVAECMQWSINDVKSRWVALLVVFSGVFFALFGGVPLKVIRLAQVANGLLLPVIGAVLVFLLFQFRQAIAKQTFWLIFVGCILLELFFVTLLVKTLGFLF